MPVIDDADALADSLVDKAKEIKSGLVGVAEGGIDVVIDSLQAALSAADEALQKLQDVSTGGK